METEFSELGPFSPVSCLQAEESPSKRRAVTPSIITHVGNLNFFVMEAAYIDVFISWINYEDFALCSLRACNRSLMHFLTHVNTGSKNFIKACLLQMQIHHLCPRPIRDWTPLTPYCSSPFCGGKTGFWVPCCRHNLPPPDVDSFPGSQSINCYITDYSDPYVVCSENCYARVEHLLKLRKEPSCGLVVAVTEYVPALWYG